MASDMVPNHTGIFSRWVVDEPDYFLQRSEPPYPNYSFTGTNLSEDDRVEIRIEDQYYTRKDAAVVFQRRDRYTGSVRYIYHGNDGTNMPWNDTSQLNLLNPEVRESLIQTIMHVARKTPIIRFDAAMTLAKKHYQRLWFPAPGSGGAIPSRTDYSMTVEQFNQVMPNEFWREVVDRINSTMPNVLLLAEAFWLMESYFVRTLGMHRVYNSAFMHMMMKEENKKYRDLIKNTLEFNPEILKRYVNFMSNPDEETAVNQFGKGDKYFGVAIMMVTMPGLPMFGHGQIEGFSEKYGMEYKQSYYDEKADEHLIHRHQREIFPLLKLRHLFGHVENFELYDFINENGQINEDVYAFSNRIGNETALVIYNNSYYETKGTILYSTARAFAGSEGSFKKPEKLSSIFGFYPQPAFFYEYKDHRTQLKYLISGKEISENGFKLHLFGYQYRVCLNFKEIYDHDGKYHQLYSHLNGRGVYSIEEALKEMELFPFHVAVENFITNENIEQFRSFLTHAEKIKFKKQAEPEIPQNFKNNFSSVIAELNKADGIEVNQSEVLKSLEKDFRKTRKFFQLWTKMQKRKTVPKWMSEMDSILPISSDVRVNENLYVYLMTLIFGQIINRNNGNRLNLLFNELMLTIQLSNALKRNLPENRIHISIELLKFLLQSYSHNDDSNKSKKKLKLKKLKNDSESEIHHEKTALIKLFMGLLKEGNVHNFLQVNEFEGIIYFNKERLEQAANWILLFKSIESLKSNSKSKQEKEKSKTEKKISDSEQLKMIKSEYESFLELKTKADKSGFDLKKLTEDLRNVNEKKSIKPKNKKRKE
jgi:hypothetical protein